MFTLRILVLPFFLLFLSYSSIAQIQLTDIKIPMILNEGEFIPFEVIIEGESKSYLTYSWEFGDGERDFVVDHNTVKHLFRDNGKYTIRVDVSDAEGNNSSISTIIDISNVDPEIRFLNGEESSVTKRFTTFQAVGYDQGNDELIYEWDFGDGNQEEGPNLNNISHSYEEKGSYRVTLTIKDGDGGSDTRTFNISVDKDWYGSISGGHNHQFSGGASLFYQLKYDEKTNEKTQCFKQLLFYDDLKNSFIVFGLSDKSSLTNNTHIVGKGTLFEIMGASMYYGLPPNVYPSQKRNFMFMDIVEGGLKNEIPLGDLLNMRLQRSLDEDWSESKLYGAIGGQLKVESMVENRISGTFQIEMDANKNDEHVVVEGAFNFTMNEFSFEQIHTDGCEKEVADLSIISYAPSSSTENVAVDFPCLEVEFSKEVNSETLSGSVVQLGYLNKARVFVPEAITFENLGGNRWNIKPLNDLRKGIKYEIRITGGSGGVLGTDGGPLDEDYTWHFNTEVDLNIPRIRVYQTIEDRPLVKNKNAMVRIQVDWNEPINVAESHIVKEFVGKIIMKNSSGSRICPEKPFVLFQNSTTFNEEQLLQAKNSIEIYGWKAKPADGNEISIEIHPRNNQCEPDPHIFKHKISHYIENHELKIEYHFLKVLNWKDSILDTEIQLVDQIMAKARMFSYQIYPINKISTQNKGGYDFDIDSDTFEYTREKMDEILQWYYFEKALTSDADVFILFYPFEIFGQKAARKKQFVSELPYSWLGPKRIIEAEFYARHLPRPSIAHEIGHTFDLLHVPNVRTRRERTDAEQLPLSYWLTHESHQHIHGFRFYETTPGENRNCEEHDYDVSVLMNYMFPSLVNVYYENSWISDEHYDAAKIHLDDWGTGISLEESSYTDARYWAALERPIPINKFKNIIVSGRQNKNNKIELNRIQYADKINNQTFVNDGNYLCQCLNESNDIIGKTAFSLSTVESNCTASEGDNSVFFGTVVSIPDKSIPRKIQIVKDNKVVAEQLLSSTVPEVEFLKDYTYDSITQKIKLVWNATDKDKLTFTLQYSPNGVNDWTATTITKKSSYDLDVSNLPSGPSPTFKIIASDGFNSSNDILYTSIKLPMNLNGYGPKEEFNYSDELYLHFSNPINPPKHLHNYILLIEKDLEGKTRERGFTVSYSDDYRKLFLHPIQPLNKGFEYQVKYGYIPLDYQSEKSAQGDIFSQLENLILAKQEKRKEEIKKKEQNEKKVETPNEFFRDIFGIPKKKPLKKTEKNNLPVKEEIKPKVTEKNYYLEDIYGSKFNEKFKWNFTYKGNSKKSP